MSMKFEIQLFIVLLMDTIYLLKQKCQFHIKKRLRFLFELLQQVGHVNIEVKIKIMIKLSVESWMEDTYICTYVFWPKTELPKLTQL